jgi:uncharacterized protein
MTVLASQQEAIAFLSALDGGVVARHETHISVVLLTATRAYKLKRAVRFPYLDFSTPKLRLEMCEREVALNRRTAPQLYLGARRLTREANGALAFDGAGELVDAVVEMRRFEEDMLLDRLAARGALSARHVESLARAIAAFHAQAAVVPDAGGAAAMRRILDLARRSLEETPAAPPDETQALLAQLGAALDRGAERLDARRAAGKTRHCHGDLTLRNICLFDGAPTPFDCLEFSDDLATIDILYDLAFLLMDLLRADRAALANVALNRYLDAGDETDGLPLIPFFMAMRAVIRTHVAAAQQGDDEARAYFKLAGRCLAPQRAQLVAVGGFSGSGKSSLAAEIAPTLGALPGARVLNSDRIRKQLCGAKPTDRLPQEAYAPEVSQQVYALLFDAAGRTLDAGWSVVADAVFDRDADRAAMEALAQSHGVGFCGLWLDVDAARRGDRVEARRNDVSDATRAVVEQQSARDPGALSWRRLDAARDLRAVAEEALYALSGAAPVTKTS